MKPHRHGNIETSMNTNEQTEQNLWKSSTSMETTGNHLKTWFPMKPIQKRRKNQITVPKQIVGLGVEAEEKGHGSVRQVRGTRNQEAGKQNPAKLKNFSSPAKISTEH